MSHYYNISNGRNNFDIPHLKKKDLNTKLFSRKEVKKKTPK